jgi:hypothetical protein
MTNSQGPGAAYLTWDGQIHGPEIRLMPSANNPDALAPTTNSYYWSEIQVGDTKRKFHLNVSGWTLQAFRQAIGSDYEVVLRDCLRNHVRDLIENNGWIPADGHERRVSDDELSGKLKDIQAKS